jgi:hypothetical protein
MSSATDNSARSDQPARADSDGLDTRLMSESIVSSFLGLIRWLEAERWSVALGCLIASEIGRSGVKTVRGSAIDSTSAAGRLRTAVCRPALHCETHSNCGSIDTLAIGRCCFNSQTTSLALDVRVSNTSRSCSSERSPGARLKRRHEQTNEQKPVSLPMPPHRCACYCCPTHRKPASIILRASTCCC